MLTVTGAWSRPPAAEGSVRATVTLIVGDGALLGLEPLPCGTVATGPTLDTVPRVVEPSGSVTTTGSPRLTCVWSAVSSWTAIFGVVEVACRMGSPGCTVLPRLALVAVTRSGPGSKATWPRGPGPGGGSP